jgi:glyoxylase I family protein
MAGKSKGHNKTLGGGGFHHVAIRSHDFDRTVDFYTRVLGFTPRIHWQQAPRRAVMLDAGDGNYLEVFEDLGTPSGGGSGDETSGGGTSGGGPILHFALRCNDTDAAIEKARDAGCEVTMEPQSIDVDAKEQLVPIRIAFCKGPDGELIEFFQNELT